MLQGLKAINLEQGYLFIQNLLRKIMMKFIPTKLRSYIDLFTDANGFVKGGVYQFDVQF